MEFCKTNVSLADWLRMCCPFVSGAWRESKYQLWAQCDRHESIKESQDWSAL